MRRILPCLKAIYLIPPFVALVVVCAWNVTQMRSISSLEKDGGALRDKIAKASSSGGISDSGKGSGRKVASGTRPGSVDWKGLAAVIASPDSSGKMGLKSMLDLQHRIAGMSKEELVAALDEIASLELPEEERSSLEEMILSALVKQDPQYALERFADRIESEPDTIGWQLSSALGEWAKKDLAGAKAWFDKQIAAGKFESKSLDGRSEMRSQFESELMESLLSSDLGEAGRRLSDLPEDQRREVLQQLSFAELSEAEQRAYADLVRQMVPTDEREGSFAHIASELAESGSIEKVGAFLDSVNASPEERSAAAMQTAESKFSELGLNGEVTTADINRMKTWLDGQSPGQTDSIIGKALAEASQEGGKFGFAEASELAMAYQKSSGNDDVLVAFLRSYSARSNLDEARHLAGMISNEQVRNNILNGLD